MTFSFERYVRRFCVPVKTALGVFTEREGIVVRAEDDFGHCGFGEIAPWQGFACESLDAAEQMLRENIAGTANVDFSRVPCLSHAISAACFFAGNPLAGAAPEPSNTAILLPRKCNEDIENYEAVFSAGGIFKIKIGLGDLSEEVRFCKKVLSIAGGFKNVRLRFDANGAWNGSDALCTLLELSEFSALEFIEQPLAPTAENDALVLALSREYAEKIALDESLREPWLLPDDANITAIVKPLLVGDFARLRDWLSCPKGTRYVISSVFETEVGRAVLRLLCYENKDNPRQLACGIGTRSFFES